MGSAPRVDARSPPPSQKGLLEATLLKAETISRCTGRSRRVCHLLQSMAPIRVTKVAKRGSDYEPRAGVVADLGDAVEAAIFWSERSCWYSAT
jgi:hypothetical protein